MIYMYIAEQLFTKSVPSTMKMKVKGGAAVDPDSGNKPKIDVYCFVKVSWIYTVFSNLQFSGVLFQGMEDTAHIVQKNGEIFNVVLGLVDVVRGTNSFYKLQALEKDSGSG